MALAKDRNPCSFYGSHMLEGSMPFSPFQLSSLSPYSTSNLFEDDHYHNQLLPALQGDDSDGDTSNEYETSQQQVQGLMSHSPPLSSPSSTNSSTGLAFHGGGSNYHHHEEARSLIDFKTTNINNNNISNNLINSNNDSYNNGGFIHSSGSFLSFQPQSCYSFGQPNDYSMWEAPNLHPDQHHLKMKSGVLGADFRVLDEANCLQKAGSVSYPETTNEWLYANGSITVNCSQESAAQQQTSFNNKRPLMEDEKNMQTLKKQCTSAGSSRKQSNKPKPSANTTKDPQSLAAKNRRERISERLKVLQDLVPNGSKVDLVTMLEKAISYVKFLQLQVKVLATDEFWPASGGKLPDITQVRDAIDAILSTQRDVNPTS
ncbi:hypothetical protein V2J09_023325 [Rumex salicifolius]